MIKIVSRKSLGIQPVYDIGVESDHNFILTTGLVASNCFNKSHSTAYAYVTYQTAYLKANYAVEYMAALLTSNSDDQDKVQKYITNCQNMGIVVKGPDINRSEVEFTPVKGKILFGLSAIKNLGEGAINCILNARQEGGEFKSLANLCDRVDLRVVNSRALESLILCGAFDKLESNRKQLLEDVKLIVPWAQNRAKDRDMGQGNLFDLLGDMNFGANNSTQEDFEAAPKAKPVNDFSSQEKLAKEKELLGFYVSAHPLKYADKIADMRRLEYTKLSDLMEKISRKPVDVIVTIAEIKTVTTKNNEQMAILQLEDLEGKMEAIVFPKSYKEIGELLVVDTPMVITGKVNKDDRDDRHKMYVDKIDIIKNQELELAAIDLSELTEETEKSEKSPGETVEIKPVEVVKNTKIQPQENIKPQNIEYKPKIDRYPAWNKANSLLMVELKPEQIKDDILLGNFKAAIEERSGEKDKPKIPVVAIIPGGDRSLQLVVLGYEFWVQDGNNAAEALTNAGFSVYIQNQGA